MINILKHLGWKRPYTHSKCKNELIFFYLSSNIVDYLILVLYSWYYPKLFENSCFIIGRKSLRYSYLLYLINCDLYITNSVKRQIKAQQSTNCRIYTIFSERYYKMIDRDSDYKLRSMVFDYYYHKIVLSDLYDLNIGHHKFMDDYTSTTPYDKNNFPLRIKYHHKSQICKYNLKMLSIVMLLILNLTITILIGIL